MRVEKPRRFLVLFTGRTGSSYLTQLLRQHPDVEMQGEVLEPLATADEQEAYLKRWYADRDEARAVGLKTKLFDVREPEAFLDFLNARRVRVLHLARANRLKQAVSFLRARELVERSQAVGSRPQANLRRSEVAKHPELEVGSTTIDVDELLAHVRLIDTAEAAIDAFLRRCDDVVRLRYEDLLGDPEPFLAEVCRAIGVSTLAALPETEVIKHTTDDLYDSIANFDDCRAALAGTPLEAQLMEGSTRD